MVILITLALVIFIRLTEECMAKITITRLPNATPEYDANQFDQMVQLLDQIILLLNTNYQQDLKEQSQSEAFFFG
jgi:hypothetical protein